MRRNDGYCARILRKRGIFGILSILVALLVRNPLLLSLQLPGRMDVDDYAEFSIMSPTHPLRLENNNYETQDPIFYNLFLPTTLPEKARIFGDAWFAWDEETKSKQFANYLERVTHEQVLEWQQHRHDTSNQYHTDNNTLLWYTHIGNPALPNALHNCTRQGTCRRLRYLSKGNEIDTLQALYQYCHAHPNETVAYIHNKGSFHASLINQQQRRDGTKAALACLPHVTTTSTSSNAGDTSCNVCAGNFQVAPQFLALSNMWSAHCDYVRQLIPPSLFEERVQSMYQNTVLHPILQNTTYACLAPVSTAPNHLGRGRYAMERWVWSHPDLRPCHVVPLPDDGEDRPSNNNNNTPSSSLSSVWSLQMGPTQKQIGRLLNRVTDNFARLEGRLFEYSYLYGKLPPSTSWIWSYYKPKFRQGGPAYMKKCLASHPDACTMLPVATGILTENDTETQSRHRLCNVSENSI
jgi:hypothetical protein